MNSLQRVLAAVTRTGPDRVPVVLVNLLQGARRLGMTPAEYFSQASHIIEGQTQMVEEFGHDSVMGFPHVVEDVLPFGAGLKYYEEGPPSVSRMALTHFSDIEQFSTPPDPGSHPDLRRTLEVIEGLSKRTRGEKLIVGAAIAPFSLPSMILGTEKWIEIVTRPEVRNRWFSIYMDVCTTYCASWANLQLQAGAHLVVLADGIASATILSRPLFEQFALPVVRDVISRINGHVAYEFVGHAEPFLDLVADCGAAVFPIGASDDPLACRKKLGGNGCLMGNLNDIKMVQWSVDRVVFEFRKLLRLWDEPFGGLILSSQGPELPYHITDEKMRALVRVSQESEARRISTIENSPFINNGQVQPVGR